MHSFLLQILPSLQLLLQKILLNPLSCLPALCGCSGYIGVCCGSNSISLQGLLTVSAVTSQVVHIPSSQADVIRCPVLAKIPLCCPLVPSYCSKKTLVSQKSVWTPECLRSIRHCFIWKLVSKQRALLYLLPNHHSCPVVLLKRLIEMN